MVIRGDSELGALLTLLVLFGGFVGMLERVNTIARGAEIVLHKRTMLRVL
jgi:hypothetical protein